MANEKFTQLPTVTSSTLADIIAAVQGGVSVQQTLQQVATLLLANTVLHFAGNPNGNVAGTQYQLLWDTVNNIMYVCTSSGNAATAVWTLSGSITFPLPMAQGGTSKALTPNAGGIVWTDTNSMEVLPGTATAGQMLQSGNLLTPAWSIPTWPSVSGTAGQIVLSDGTNNVYSTPSFPVTAGAAGSIVISDGTNKINSTSLWPNTVGTAGQMLRSNGTANAYSTSTFADTYGASTLLYSNGANTVTGLATANSALLRTNASGVPAWSASMTNGQLMIGSTGATPVLATLTAGANISIVNTAGTITIAGTGLAGFSWTVVTGTSQAMLSNNGYIANNGSLVSMSLPATSAVGDEIDVMGKGAGGWRITQGAGQSIILGSSTTTVGAGGSLSSTNAKDSLYMICTVANLEWQVGSGVQGNITVV